MNTSITALDFIKHEKRYSEYVIIDIREKEEFNKWHIKNSINIPIQELIEQIQNMNDKVKYLVVCNPGTASKAACSILCAMRFDAISIYGGIESLKKYLGVHNK